MNSRLLDRLASEISSSTDPVRADRLRAERAGALARHGRVAEAREVLGVLQNRSHLARDVVLRAGLSLSDALADYFGEVAGTTRGKLEQALAFAAQSGERAIEARCEAWLAHLDYVEEQVEGAARHAARSLALAGTEEHSAQARACMVVAMAYHYAGRFDLAQPWYTRSRQHASAEGDDATLSALIYNMAALRGEHVRRAAIFPHTGALAEEVRQALLAGDSSTHFDQRMGGSALEVLRPILRAGVLLAQDRYPQALVLYEAYFGDAIATGLGRFESSLRADVAWCRLKLRQPDMAREQAALAESALRADCIDDDIAMTHARLAQVHGELGDASKAQAHRELADRHWQRHCERRARSVGLMDAACGPHLA